MSPDEERSLVESWLLMHQWRYAKTMPQFPHWYTLRTDWPDTARFERCIIYIREHGYQKVFGRTTYTYLNFREYKYWTMGSPAKETKLINRDLIEGHSQP